MVPNDYQSPMSIESIDGYVEGSVPRAFVAGPLTSTLDETGLIRLEYRRFISSIIACVEDAGYQVLNAHRREDWGRALMGPNECVRLDLEGVCSADLFIVLPGNPASGGVHIEIGWASAHSIPTILLLEEDAYYSPMVLGLDTVAPVWTICWNTPDDCVRQLQATLANTDLKQTTTMSSARGNPRSVP